MSTAQEPRRVTAVDRSREQRDNAYDKTHPGDDEEEPAEPDGDENSDEDEAHTGERAGALPHPRVRRVALEKLPR